jgi:cerevisin
MFVGFAAALDEESLDLVRARKEVAFVEPNQVVYAHDVQPNPPSWGLARIWQRQFQVRFIRNLR